MLLTCRKQTRGRTRARTKTERARSGSMQVQCAGRLQNSGSRSRLLRAVVLPRISIYVHTCTCTQYCEPYPETTETSQSVSTCLRYYAREKIPEQVPAVYVWHSLGMHLAGIFRYFTREGISSTGAWKADQCRLKKVQLRGLNRVCTE